MPSSFRMLLLGVLLLVSSPALVHGQAQSGLPTPTITFGQLAADILLLREAMTALHPGLDLHNSWEELERLDSEVRLGAEVLKTQYGDAIPIPRAYLLLAEVVAAIRDGHTQVSMYNQGDYVTAALYTRPDLAPFSFRLVGTRMIVTGDATPDRLLPAGTEILSMDGMPVADILAALIPYASADGSNDAKRLDELVVGGVLGPAERFDVIYSLLFDPDGPLELVARRPGVDAAELSVTRLTRDARREVLLSRYPTLPRSMDDLLRSATLNEETAYLYIGSFATFSMNIDYDQWLRGEFEKINASGAENLVVDLRDVAGGMDDAATLLLRHLLSESVSVSQWENHTAYKRVPEAIRPHIRSWSNAFYDLSGQVTETTDGRFKARSLPEVQLVPAPDAFKGKVVVLVDATASSATFYLAKAIQESGVATLVGQQTGGSLKGLNAGLMVFLTLPNSGVVVDVPLFGSRPAEPGPDRGVYPDVLVEQEVEAIIAGRDLEVEAALRVFAGDR